MPRRSIGIRIAIEHLHVELNRISHFQVGNSARLEIEAAAAFRSARLALGIRRRERMELNLVICSALLECALMRIKWTSLGGGAGFRQRKGPPRSFVDAETQSGTADLKILRRTVVA